MEEQHRNLVNYAQLVTLKKSQETLFVALAEALLSLDRSSRESFLRNLVDSVSEQLQNSGAETSAHAGLLGVMFRELTDRVLPQDPSEG